MSENLLDDWFGKREEHAVQTNFFEEILPAEEILQGRPARLKQGEVTIYKDKKNPLFPTSISDIALIYPYLLKALKIRDDIELQDYPPNENSEAEIIGIKLHEADALFAVLLSVILEKFQPWQIGSLLPTSPQSQIVSYQRAIDGIKLREISDEEQLFEAFSLAWEAYLHNGGFVKTRDTPLLNGLRIYNPQIHDQIIYSQQMLDYGKRLAQAWAGAVINPQIGPWEFYRHALSQREVMVVMNLKCGLQIRGKLDNVTRLVGEHRKITTQVTDLKPLRLDETSDVTAEIKLREAQFALLLAEWFTASFMSGNKSLERRRGAFATRGDHKNRALYGRSSFGFRYFDKETGLMTFEEVNISDEERENFNEWLIWYAQEISKHRQELKIYLGKVKSSPKK